MIRAPRHLAPGAALRLNPRDYISYSAIRTYQQCPLRYFFRYIAALPEETVSASLVFGSAVHRAVERHFSELMTGNPPPALEVLLDEYDQYWRDADCEPVRFAQEDDVESLAKLAQRMLVAFRASDLAHPTGQIIGVEEQLRGPVIAGCPDLLGRLDLLIETADALEVVDLKTSRSRWSREQVEDQASQLWLYSELVQPLAPRKQLKLQFAVLTKTKEPALDLHSVRADRRQIDRTKRIVERVWRAIESGHFYPAPLADELPELPVSRAVPRVERLTASRNPILFTSPFSGVSMELWIVLALLSITLVATLMALVRQVRLQRALRRLLNRLLDFWRTRHAPTRTARSNDAPDAPLDRRL